MIFQTVNSIFCNYNFFIDQFYFPCLVCITDNSFAFCFRGVPNTGFPLYNNFHYGSIAFNYRLYFLYCMNFIKENSYYSLKPTFKSSPAFYCGFRKNHLKFFISKHR